jgi:D-galactarolactone cycloisomerase
MFSGGIYEKTYNGSRSTPALERGVAHADEVGGAVVMEAFAGVDIAVWDVKAQFLGIPLYQALDAVRKSVRGYASGGLAPGDEAEAELASSIAKCMHRVRAARRSLGA